MVTGIGMSALVRGKPQLQEVGAVDAAVSATCRVGSLPIGVHVNPNIERVNRQTNCLPSLDGSPVGESLGAERAGIVLPGIWAFFGEKRNTVKPIYRIRADWTIRYTYRS